MDTPCLPCLDGPFGFAGHPDLVVQTVGDARMSLRCARCGSFWSRSLEREGYFSWAAMTERMSCNPRMGIAVPPLSTSDDLRSLPWRGAPWIRAALLAQSMPRRLDTASPTPH
jgi:hypothetical protein